MESSSDVEVYSVDDENMFMGLGVVWLAAKY